ncbi:MAG: porin family protein [Ferruginibacter sp.]
MKIKILFTRNIYHLVFCKTYAQSFHIGIKAGANLNKVSGEALKDEFSFGYHAGVFAEVGFGKKWGIEPDILFVQTTSDTANNFNEIYNTHNFSHVKLNYLSIPILASYKFCKVFALQAGPQFGVLLNSSKSLAQNGQDAFKQGDLSAVVGLQFHFLSVRAYGRYVIGLSNINDLDNQNKWTNQSIQVGVGYAIF